MNADCPFCTIESSRVFYTGVSVFAIWDQYPVSPGHALLIPRRHIASWFDATQEEQHELLQAVSSVREQILQRFQADGFNIGINDGTAAGQTVRHLHVHLIPRYRGDVPDPAGGVRYVIPEKANYLRGGMGAGVVADSDAGHRLVTGEHDPLLPYLISHLSVAAKADIAVAFTMRSGIQILEPHFKDLLDRGGELRFLTGDYLDVSDPGALTQLLDLKKTPRDRGLVSLRIFQAGSLSFHPKVYIIRYQDGSGVAIVGSSNLSASALGAGVEWNYRVISSHDQAGYQEALQAFGRLFEHPATTEITVPWLDAYRTRRRQRPEPAPEALIEPPDPPPTPNVVQQEALQQLEESRTRGNRAGLVVLATGLGKTWLSAFDSNRPEFQRILFVAHREEILDQAQKTFRRMRPEAHLGFYTGGERTETADILFASVQTLSRVQHLHRFAPDHFDYIVVDEFHHADARTYRRLIDYFEPRFLLGLTATPERTDGGDLLALCQENLVYRCDIPEGISRNLLCPFHYFGVPDEVDYAQIPWRGNRFDPEVLSQHLATQARAQNALEQYLANRGKTTLAFCCSIQHTEFMKQHFTQAGIRSAAVHSGAGSDLRSVSLERLRDGDIDVLFSVDMFSEGVDLPDVDTVLMLRPTESRILWLQQLGRGLRWVEGKTLKAIDYIGNHRSFLDKTNTLLQLIYGSEPGYSLVAERLRVIASGNPELPPGCAVTYYLRSIDILRRLLPREDHADSIKAFYVDFRTRQGRRPTAVEAFHEGYNPRTLRTAYGSWLQFVAQMEGDLMPAPQRALLAGRTGAFLGVLESTPMTKSYKMLTLLAMLNEDQLPGSLTIEALGDGIVRLARRSEHYLRDVSVDMADREALRTLLEDNPVAAWTQGRGTGAVAYFGYSDGQFRSLIEVPADQREDFQELVREIVDWRLADYLERQKGAGWDENHVVCKVIQRALLAFLWVILVIFQGSGMKEVRTLSMR